MVMCHIIHLPTFSLWLKLCTLFTFSGSSQLPHLEDLSHSSQYSKVLKILPCGTKFLRVLIFAIFEVFLMIRKPKKHPAKKNSQKNFIRKNLLHCRNYIQTSPFTLYLNRLFRLERKHSEIKRRNCSQYTTSI